MSVDYEQRYHDIIYENRRLKKYINELETEIEILTTNKNNKSLDLVIKQINDYFIKKGK